MLPTESRGEEGGNGTAGAGDTPEHEPSALTEQVEEESPTETAELFPPGPLEVLSLRPNRILVELNGEKRVLGRALDAGGRRILEGLSLQWELPASVGSLRADPRDPHLLTIVAGERPAEGILSARAREPATGREASASAPVSVVPLVVSGTDEGIPEPELVDAPGAAWRSRLVEDRWQVNSGHADYVRHRIAPR